MQGQISRNPNGAADARRPDVHCDHIVGVAGHKSTRQQTVAAFDTTLKYLCIGH